MSTSQIVNSLPQLTDEELRQVARSLDAVFRERHQAVLDDEYGVLTEEDLTTVAAEAWGVIDGGQ